MRFAALGLAVMVAGAPAWAITGNSGKVCDVRDFGAKGDGITLDTDAIQRAIDACSATVDGGIVRLGDNGTFLSGPLLLKSHIRFEIEGRSTLLAKHPLLNGSSEKAKLPMVRAANVSDVGITGNGLIDGNEREATAGMSIPLAIDISATEGARIEGVSISNSAGIAIHGSNDVHVSNVRIASTVASELPGIVISRSRQLAFDHISISVGGYAVKLYEPLILEKQSPISDVAITDSHFRNGQGLDIEAGQDIRGERLYFGGTTKGISISPTLGTVSNLSFIDIQMFGVAEPVVLAASHAGLDHAVFQNLRAVGATSAGSIAGSTDAPITALSLQDVHIEAITGLTVENAQGSFEAVNVNAAQGQGLLVSGSANVERR